MLKNGENFMAKFQGILMNPSKFHRSQLKFFFILVPIAIIMALPILYIFTTAFKPFDELFKFPQSIFVYKPTLDNFKMLFDNMNSSSIPMTRYLFNSIVISGVTVLASIVLSISAAYVLSKKDFKLKNLIFEINTISLMFVATAVSIPRFIIIIQLGLYDNFWINVLPLLAMPIGLFLVKQFVDGIPDSLIEAAKMDGANDFVILFKIIVPMSKPALATVAILSFQTAWANVEASNYYLNQEAFKSFGYYMASFTSTTNAVAGKGLSAASTLIMFVPNLIIFLVFQSKVMDTMAHSGIK